MPGLLSSLQLIDEQTAFYFSMPHEICLKHSTWPRSVQYKLRPCVDFLNLLKKTTLLLFH